MKTPFNRKSTAPLNAISPLGNGETHRGIEGIKVRLIDYPDEKRFKKALAKMSKATIGGEIDEDINEELGEELFKGGLQTGLEAGVFTFEVSGVSRACTHQLVRTRKAAYHQQSSRYTNMGEFDVRIPETIAKNDDLKQKYINFIKESRRFYKELVDNDIPYQDARFIAPVGIETYIICEYPIRTFLNVYAYRACPMFQWEIVEVFKQMKQEVIKVFPWMEPYIKIGCEKTQKCMYQGWESTKAGCDKPWRSTRDFKSEHFTAGEENE